MRLVHVNESAHVVLSIFQRSNSSVRRVKRLHTCTECIHDARIERGVRTLRLSHCVIGCVGACVEGGLKGFSGETGRCEVHRKQRKQCVCDSWGACV